MTSHCSSATALLALVLAVAPADGQRPPVVRPGTEQLVLRSTANDVSYKLYVSLPRGYESGVARHPVERRSYPGLRMRWSVEEDEIHPSIFPGALSDGLRFVLQGR